MTSPMPIVAREAVTRIEAVGGRIEHAFAQVGGDLGRAHELFEQLYVDVGRLGDELAGAKIDGASTACGDISKRLNDLASLLPAETALLATIGGHAKQASLFLKDILKHIGVINIIARSSRIEAASLDGERGDFLSFTKEAADLAVMVQASIVACSKDQDQLAEAVAAALKRQAAFEGRYRPQLIKASTDLEAACGEIRQRQAQRAELAALATSSTAEIRTAVGAAIVAMQVGDSTRQRLEHICRALGTLDGAPALAPAPGDDIEAGLAVTPVVQALQGAQLKDAIATFEADIGTISHSMSALASDASKMVGHSRALCGGGDQDMNSFLETMKRRLATALSLIADCAEAKAAVDESMAALDAMLGKFRSAIASLGETIVDITLVGMNAGLKASHLGFKGRAFVVIANELKATADKITASAKLLGPEVDDIAATAGRLKNLRKDEQTTHVAELETTIVQTLRDIEIGNTRLTKLMDNLSREGSRFETLVIAAKDKMTELSGRLPPLAATADTLEQSLAGSGSLSAEHQRAVAAALERLHAQYTMQKERNAHRAFASRHGFLDTAQAATVVEPPATDDIFF